MTDFAARVNEWHLFYAAIMGASATLMGLLFVAVSLNKPIIGHRDNLHLKLYSRQTFGLFLSVISISLCFLIPRQSPAGIGIPVSCIGVSGLITSFQGIYSHIAKREFAGALRRYAWPCAAFIAIILASAHVLFFLDEPSLHLIMAGMIMLLVSATRSTWFLLIELKEV